MNNRVNVNVDEIKIKLHTIFKGVSVPKQDAEIVINALLDAETSGVESHGLMRMKAYVDRIVEHKIAANPIIKVEENGVVVRIDNRPTFDFIGEATVNDPRYVQILRDYFRMPWQRIIKFWIRAFMSPRKIKNLFL